MVFLKYRAHVIPPCRLILKYLVGLPSACVIEFEHLRMTFKAFTSEQAFSGALPFSCLLLGLHPTLLLPQATNS